MAATKKSGNEKISAGSRGPDVIVEFLLEQGNLSVAVRNSGDLPALKIAVQFNKKIIGLGGAKEISDLALFKSVEFLGPGREIVAFVDASSSYFARKQPTKIIARITYTDLNKQKYDQTIFHDLAIYRDIPYLSSPSDKDLQSYKLSEES